MLLGTGTMEQAQFLLAPRGSGARPAVLFLSHSGVDAEAARELKRRLEDSVSGREAGLVVWLDVAGNLVPGPDGWQAQIERVIEQTCTAFAVYVGSTGVVNWVENEVRLGLSRATRDRIPFVPILARDIRSDAVLPFARQYQAVRDPLNDAGEFGKLLEGVLQTGKPPIIIDPPFVGLRAMKEEDGALFFGRSAELDELSGKLATSRLAAVVADSGSGKSSLVRAGLIPHYRGGILADQHSREPDRRIWHVVVMHPGRSPVDGLRLAVTMAAEQRGLSFDETNALRNAIDFANAPQTAFALQCGLPAGTTETLLVVDQLEELFTQAPGPQRKPFIDWFLSLVAPGAQPSIRVALTIRGDHFNLCSSHEELFALLSRESSVLRLKSLSPGGLDAIVRQPLKLAGHTDRGEQEALISQVRQQVSDRPGDLALVQMALYETWNRRRQHGDDLLESFAAVGGVAGALATAADEVRTKKLDDDERQLLEAVLVRLVVLGETAGATRRTASIVEFGPADSAKRLLISKLADEEYSRLLLVSSDTVEICHEQLTTQWPWWQTWINVPAHALDMRRLAPVMAKARDWLEAPVGERESFLATGADLQIFSNLAAAHADWLSEVERAFVADSRRQDDARIRKEHGARDTERRLRQEAEENAQRAEDNAKAAQSNAARAEENARKAKWRQWLSAAFAVLLAFAAVVALFAWHYEIEQKGIAQQQTQRAVANETRALTALSSVALAAGDANGAAELAIAAWPRSKDDANRPQLESTLQALSAPLSGSRLYEREFNHDGPVNGALLTQDGGRALSWSDDKTLRLWDLPSGKQIGLSIQFTSPLDGALLTKDGSRALSWSADNTLQLWDLASGKQICPPMQHQGEIFGALLVPDGGRALSWSDDNKLRQWDLLTGQQIGTSIQHEDEILGALLTPDGSRVLSWSGDILRMWDLTTSRQINPSMLHGGLVQSVLLTPDASRVLSWSDDNTLRLWDLATGRQIGASMQHQGRVNGALLTPDGSRALSWSEDKTLRLWDLATGQQVGPSIQHDGPVKGAVITPDGRRALSRSDDKALRLWDLATGQQIGSSMQHDGPVRGAVITGGGSRALSWSDDKNLRLWDLATGQQIGPSMQHGGPVGGAVISADGGRALSWSFDNTLRLWDLAGSQIGSSMLHDDGVVGALLTPDRNRALSWSLDNTLRLWDLATGRQTGPAMRHWARVNGALLTPDGGRAISWSDDKTLRLWDLATGRQTGPAMQHWARVNGALLTPDGGRAISWSDDKTLRLWDLASGRQIGPAMQHWARVNGALLTPDGGRVISWSEDKRLRLWDLASGKQIGPAMQHDGPVTGALFTPDGGRAISWSDDERLRLWDLASGKQIGPAMQHDGPVTGALFTPDGGRAISWSDDKTLRLWDLASGRQIGPAMQHHRPVTGALLAPDGNHALSWSQGTLRLWDLAGGSQIGPSMQNESAVFGAILTSDGNRALSWSFDGTLQLWDLASGKEIRSPSPMSHNGPVVGAEFVDDSSRVLSWSSDGTIRLWDVGTPAAPNLLETACRLLKNTDLAPYGKRYGIELQEPICSKGVAIPPPDWTRIERMNSTAASP
ncbi:TIR domain-containing protein [Rhizobium ruizarguesonis]|nr:TIR domain-containing protein [Rhizobium ruizarguesonis]